MRCPATECAKMLVLCNTFLVALALALAAPGGSRSCYDYCKSEESKPINGAVPLECNCEDLVDTEINSKETSFISLDDTGVYFVPAEVHLFQEQFASQPFFISNPAKLIPKSRPSRINREFTPSKQAFNDPMITPSEHVEIFERTETISHTSINQEKYPLYLDLAIENSPDNGRAAIPKGTLIEDFEATERALVECLDFQVLHYTRKYGFMKEFREFWEVRSLDKYEQLSNSDIEENIQKYCSDTESIVEQSLREIKQGLPKRRHESGSKEETEDNIIKIDSTTEIVVTDIAKHVGNPTALVAPTLLNENITQLSETLTESTENSTVSKKNTEVYNSSYNPIEIWPFVHLTLSPTLTEDNEIHQDSSPSTPTETDTNNTVITTESTFIGDNQGQFRSADFKSKSVTASEIELDLDTMGSEDVFHTYIPITKAEVKISYDAQLSDNKTTFLPIFTTPQSIAESLAKESTTTEINTINSQYNTLSHDTSEGSVTGSYPHVQNIYNEEDIKIPKIITKECQNNTVQSTIYGTEELPNNDFTDYTTAQSDLKTRRENSDRNMISGKLYFVAKKELVPMRFIQTDTGTISLGIDGISLCDKLLHGENKKYNLLATLCDYVQNYDMYQNKNSTTI